MWVNAIYSFINILYTKIKNKFSIYNVENDQCFIIHNTAISSKTTRNRK